MPTCNRASNRLRINGNKERETTDMSTQPQMQAMLDLADLDAWVEFHIAVQDWAGVATCLPLAQKAANLFI